MILLITATEDGGVRGRVKEVVSHGIDLKTEQVVILPQVHPSEIGVYDSNMGEWILKE